jgi:dephospho-CoA kinase
MILGIAGKACSGKNAAASFFEQRGFRSIDLDILGHKALGDKAEEVALKFGSDLLRKDKTVNRKALGEIVFRNHDKLLDLEAILHPVIFKMVRDIIAESHGEDLILNGAILGKIGMDSLCDKVLWIETPLFKRIKQAFFRDRNKISHIFSRIRSQQDLTVQHFSAGVDIYMVRNRGNLTDLEKEVDSFLQFPEKYKRV